MKKENIIYLAVGILGVLFILNASLGSLGLFSGIPNPASVYCEEQGGTLEIRTNELGQYGVCIFSDGSECEEWAFYRGECYKKECPMFAPLIPCEERDSCKISGCKTVITSEGSVQNGCRYPGTFDCEPQICSQVAGWTIENNKCISKTQYCEEYHWFNSLEECQETISNGECLFKLDDYCIKLWMVLTLVGLIVLFLIGGKKK